MTTIKCKAVKNVQTEFGAWDTSFIMIGAGRNFQAVYKQPW